MEQQQNQLYCSLAVGSTLRWALAQCAVIRLNEERWAPEQFAIMGHKLTTARDLTEDLPEGCEDWKLIGSEELTWPKHVDFSYDPVGRYINFRFGFYNFEVAVDGNAHLIGELYKICKSDFQYIRPDSIRILPHTEKLLYEISETEDCSEFSTNDFFGFRNVPYSALVFGFLVIVTQIASVFCIMQFNWTEKCYETRSPDMVIIRVFIAFYLGGQIVSAMSRLLTKTLTIVVLFWDHTQPPRSTAIQLLNIVAVEKAVSASEQLHSHQEMQEKTTRTETKGQVPADERALLLGTNRDRVLYNSAAEVEAGNHVQRRPTSSVKLEMAQSQTGHEILHDRELQPPPHDRWQLTSKPQSVIWAYRSKMPESFRRSVRQSRHSSPQGHHDVQYADRTDMEEAKENRERRPQPPSPPLQQPPLTEATRLQEILALEIEDLQRIGLLEELVNKLQLGWEERSVWVYTFWSPWISMFSLHLFGKRIFPLAVLESLLILGMIMTTAQITKQQEDVLQSVYNFAGLLLVMELDNLAMKIMPFRPKELLFKNEDAVEHIVEKAFPRLFRRLDYMLAAYCFLFVLLYLFLPWAYYIYFLTCVVSFLALTAVFYSGLSAAMRCVLSVPVLTAIGGAIYLLRTPAVKEWLMDSCIWIN
jgi:hypothetical protein